MPNFLTREYGKDPQDAPAGDGARGAARRFGVGFRQGVTPDNTAQVLMRGANPMAYLLSGLGEGIKDSISGSGWWNSLRNSFGGNRPPTPGGMSPDYRQQMGAGPPTMMDDPRYADAINSGPVDYRYNDAVNSGPPEAQWQRLMGMPGQGRSGAFAGEVIGQRTGNVRNDRALEGMAEGLLGSSAQSRMRQSGLQARREMERMFGNTMR